MGLLDRFFAKITIPRFGVSAYGKLPCHKEYLKVGSDPAFVQLRQILDRGFEARISAREPRPHVLPDSCFYVAMDGKTHLVGHIFDSDDGIRAFPFLLVAPLPAKMARLPANAFWQTLEQLWLYLEAYGQDLRVQPSAAEFYRRVRGVIHRVDAFTPKPMGAPQPVETSGLLTRTEVQAKGPLPALDLAENPRFILWPASYWPQQIASPAYAYLGSRGLDDIDVALFRQEAEPTPAMVLPPGSGEEAELPELRVDVPNEELTEDAQPPPMAPPMPLGKKSDDQE